MKAEVPAPKMSEYPIRSAVAADIAQIHALAESYLLSNLPLIDQQEHGFLVSGFTQADYLAYIHQADHFYVWVDNGVVSGYILAYSSEQIPLVPWLSQLTDGVLELPTIHVKQICVSQESIGSGIAAQLYTYLLDKTPDANILTVIVDQPPNHRSIKFHQKIGFTRKWTAVPPDGLKRGIWLKRGGISP